MQTQHELYKDFLQYAVDLGTNLEYMQAMYDLYCGTEPISDGVEWAVRSFEKMMYDFLGVTSIVDDERLYDLIEAPAIYEINHPNNFN